MKIAFSERRPNYGSYVFPYHVWGFLEEGETIRNAYDQGFLPGNYDMSHFYLARSVRVQLEEFKPTGRTRYVERKCAHISIELTERRSFDPHPYWEKLANAYFDSQAINREYRRRRFFEMLDSPLTTHSALFYDTRTSDPVGLAPLFIQDGITQYGIPIYDPSYRSVSIGNHMMAATLQALRDKEVTHCYLGLCYDKGSLYKTRFPGMQFFNGQHWSSSREELHFIIENQHGMEEDHLLGWSEYVERFGEINPSLLTISLNQSSPGTTTL
ncbi:hypothetical protein AB0D13_09515 [Streptomyces sp. NPDC048430]|uniref:hypothetical protein n=1 Tax=Streptomyces sp. NPDC048430 TaxID=3155388 RepID=UPI003432B15A